MSTSFGTTNDDYPSQTSFVSLGQEELHFELVVVLVVQNRKSIVGHSQMALLVKSTRFSRFHGKRPRCAELIQLSSGGSAARPPRPSIVSLERDCLLVTPGYRFIGPYEHILTLYRWTY
jgi:hypothetical protein